MPPHIIMDCISFILNTSYLQFMGSPLSLVLAELMLQFLESSIFALHNFEFLFYFRCVDDILVCLPEKNTNNMFSTFNSFNSKIQFTFEVESNNSINFLDVTIIREPNFNLILDWYRKPTSCGRYISYFYYLPKQYKIAGIINLVDGVLKLSHPLISK